MPKRVVPMTDVQVKNAKPKDKDYKLSDGFGLVHGLDSRLTGRDLGSRHEPWHTTSATGCQQIGSWNLIGERVHRPLPYWEGGGLLSFMAKDLQSSHKDDRESMEADCMGNDASKSTLPETGFLRLLPGIRPKAYQGWVTKKILLTFQINLSNIYLKLALHIYWGRYGHEKIRG